MVRVPAGPVAKLLASLATQVLIFNAACMLRHIKIVDALSRVYISTVAPLQFMVKYPM